MSAVRVQIEHMRIDARTRRATLWSVVVHALLLTWMFVQPHVLDEPPQLTEITWIDPEVLQPRPPSAARAPEPVQVAKKQPVQPTPPRQEQVLKRAPREEPDVPAQMSKALQDRLSLRMATLQQTERSGTDTPAAVKAPAPISGVRPARPTEDTLPSPVQMKREKGTSTPAVALKRVKGQSATPRLADVRVPERESHTTRPQNVDPSQVRNLAGASLMGPVVDRALLAHTKPTYPEWAKKQAIEGSVSLYFVVRPDGRIKENIMVEKTSGFEEFDLNAIRALRGWKFEPLGPGSTGEQWGRITFHFRLR